MEMKEIITFICTILSALFAGASFTFYKKNLKISGDYKETKNKYKNINQQSGKDGKNIIGDNNKF